MIQERTMEERALAIKACCFDLMRVGVPLEATEMIGTYADGLERGEEITFVDEEVELTHEGVKESCKMVETP